ncbi:MAG: hypothetical protein GY842_08685 [bacterium]|nr:hypothetical protein [bacterium]
MAVRSPDRLRREQAALIAEYRAEQAREGRAAGPGDMAVGLLRAGQVTAVVETDETHGPHLVVQPQSFSNLPPDAGAANEPTRIVHPTPNLSVTDYQADEYVAVWITKGAVLAVKL